MNHQVILLFVLFISFSIDSLVCQSVNIPKPVPISINQPPIEPIGEPITDAITDFRDGLNRYCDKDKVDIFEKVFHRNGCSGRAALKWNGVDVFSGYFKLEDDVRKQDQKSFCCVYWETMECVRKEVMVYCSDNVRQYQTINHPFKQYTDDICFPKYTSLSACK